MVKTDRAYLIRKTLGLVDFGPHVNQKKGGKMYSKKLPKEV
jgi:hypothetical protein